MLPALFGAQPTVRTWYSARVNSTTLVGWLVVAAVLGVLAYWSLKESTRSRATRQQSHHPPTLQTVVRWLPQVIGLILILQLLGILDLAMAVSESVAEVFSVVGLAVFLVAAALAVWARQALGENWAHAADYQVLPGQALVVTGPYRFVRHPIYLAFLLMFVGIELLVVSWLIVLALPIGVLLVWQSRKEEQLLAQAFGPLYDAYRRQTGFFFPKVMSRS